VTHYWAKRELNHYLKAIDVLSAREDLSVGKVRKKLGKKTRGPFMAIKGISLPF